MIPAFVEMSSLVALLASGRAPEIVTHHSLVLTLLPVCARRVGELAQLADFDEQLRVLERRGQLITTAARGDVRTTLMLAQHLDTTTSAVASAAISAEAPVVLLSDDSRTLRTLQRERPDLALITALYLIRTWQADANADVEALLARVGRWFTPTFTHPEGNWWRARRVSHEQCDPVSQQE
jgi:hypothetical protein